VTVAWDNFAPDVRDHLVPIDAVQRHPENPRRGDLRALRESIEANGFYSVLLAQKSTGYMVVGNHRLQVLRDLGAEYVPVMLIDMSDEDALRILLADNRTSDLAFYDDPTLFHLLQKLEGNFYGTGYDRASYELLMQGMEGEQILGNVAQGFVPKDRMEGYLQSDIRSLVLPYQGDDYDEVAGGLQRLRTELNVETNAEVVQVLVAEAVGGLDR
jgi:hypothetical protein